MLSAPNPMKCKARHWKLSRLILPQHCVRVCTLLEGIVFRNLGISESCPKTQLSLIAGFSSARF